MKIIPIGSHAKYTHYVAGVVGRPSGLITHDALVIGAEGDKAHLAFLDLSRSQLLGGSDWRLAFDRAVSIPTEDAKGDGQNYFELVDAADEKKIAALEGMVTTSESTQKEFNKLSDFVAANFADAAIEGKTIANTVIRLLTPEESAPAPQKDSGKKSAKVKAW